MIRFKAKIRLHGSNDNEVLREDLSYPETLILKTIHGDDAVLNVEQMGDDDRNPENERDRLTALYGTEYYKAAFGHAKAEPPMGNFGPPKKLVARAEKASAILSDLARLEASMDSAKTEA